MSCPSCGYDSMTLPAPAEPPIGTWVRDRHGASHVRITDPDGRTGWAASPSGMYAFGLWPDMWTARGPLAVCGPYGDALTPDTWTPEYDHWRHGGWYVTNIRYPSGAAGCVSRNYADRKWRIVCAEPRTYPGSANDRTYPTRDAAARAEHALAEALTLSGV